LLDIAGRALVSAHFEPFGVSPGHEITFELDES
jgi:hypothetical protein